MLCVMGSLPKAQRVKSIKWLHTAPWTKHSVAAFYSVACPAPVQSPGLEVRPATPGLRVDLCDIISYLKTFVAQVVQAYLIRLLCLAALNCPNIAAVIFARMILLAVVAYMKLAIKM